MTVMLPCKEELVELVALAIEQADIDRNVPEGTVDHPGVSSWGEHLARAALAACEHQSLSDRIAVLEGLISEQNIERLAEDIAVAVIEPAHVMKTRHSAMVRLGERLRNPLPSDLKRIEAALTQGGER